jgi:anaphase-promoting complex subunit 5
MARYLTPSKIGLLAIIELYTDGVIPTASTIPILSFFAFHTLPSNLLTSQLISQDAGGRQLTHNPTISIEEFERVLSVHPSASGLPGRSLWDLFMKKLWELNSLHALHEFFERRTQLLAKTKDELQRDALMGLPPPSLETVSLSRTSPLGAFVRRAVLEFVRLRFHDTLSLWKSFVVYRQVTWQTWSRRNAGTGRWSFDEVLHEGDVEWGDDALEAFSCVAYGDVLGLPVGEAHMISTDDVEVLLEFQVEQMQKMGTRIPESVRDQFSSVLNSNIMIPSLSHYVKFLDAWRFGDYPTSFDSLHRFFDYTMQNRDRTFYQYALLNLAVLQADFGCYQDAVIAMQETVSVARENKDMGCLNFSLSWLYHFGTAHPEVVLEVDKSNMIGVEKEGLLFLRTKAKEAGMWSLWSSALLSEAKAGLSTGGSVAVAFENVLKSSQLTITKSMLNNVGSQLMLQSSIWTRLGVRHMAWLYCELFLRCYATAAPFDEFLRFTCRSSYLLAETGKYDEAMAKMESLDGTPLRSLKASQYWLIFRGILRLKRDLHQHKLDQTDQLLSQLLQCRGGDSDLTFELNMLEIETLMRRRNYQAALARIEKLSTELRLDGEDVLFQIKLLKTKALLLDRCGRPQKGFSLAVKAAVIALRARLLSITWEIMGVIANILTSLGEFDASARVLVSVLPRALETDDCAINAQLYTWLGDAYMGLAGQASSSTRRRTESLTKALESIDRASAEYARLGDIDGQCEMTARKTMIMNQVGDPVLVNDYAAVYSQLKSQPEQSWL